MVTIFKVEGMGFRKFKTIASGGLAFGGRLGWFGVYYYLAAFLECCFQMVPADYRDSLGFSRLVTTVLAGEKPY